MSCNGGRVVNANLLGFVNDILSRRQSTGRKPWISPPHL